MSAYKLDIRKGDRNDVIDWTGILPNGVTINAGMVCSIDPSSGNLRAGLVAADGQNQCPLFAWNGVDINNYPDVRRDGSLSGSLNAQTRSNVSGGGGYAMPYAGQARFGTIAWRSAVELSTTAVNTAAGQLAGYVVGAPLTTVATGNAGAGTLQPLQTAATDLIIGRVAPQGLYTSPDGYATLAFYPVLEFPARTVTVTIPTALGA
jgi:hypothetical protein